MRGANVSAHDTPAQGPAGTALLERETGPLVPRWFSALMYGVFVPWCVFSFLWIGRAMVVQHRIWGAMDVLSGPWQGEMPPMESAAVQASMSVLERSPRNGLLYIIQELQQDEIGDRRMVRAIALRKAVSWAVESQRRRLFEELLANMNDKGEMPDDYVLPPQEEEALLELIKEREENPSASYEQAKITEVLRWIVEGRRTPPVGPEKRRIRSLLVGYEKKKFFGAERHALKALMKEWAQSDDAARKSAAEEFVLMLESKQTALSPEEAARCSEEADGLEEIYMIGRRRLTEGLHRMANIIGERDIFVDHSHLWDLLRLLDYRDDAARRSIAEAVMSLKGRKYALAYLAEFILKDSVNPVMAVETARLTKDEHEQLLGRENYRRRLNCIEVAWRLAIQYCRQPFEIEGVPKEKQAAFFRLQVIGSIEAVAEDKEVGRAASEALQELQQPCAQHFE